MYGHGVAKKGLRGKPGLLGAHMRTQTQREYTTAANQIVSARARERASERASERDRERERERERDRERERECIRLLPFTICLKYYLITVTLYTTDQSNSQAPKPETLTPPQRQALTLRPALNYTQAVKTQNHIPICTTQRLTA